MRSTGLELFMEILKHMIYRNDNPFINNHPSILSERPQLQLLYEELDSMIQTLLIMDEHHEVQQVTDLKKRFKDAAQEAHDIVDLFVYTINRGNRISLNLEDVIRLIKSIKDEFLNMKNENMKMDSFTRTECHQAQSVAAAGTSCSRNPLRKTKVSGDVVVGFDRPAALVRDKLVEDQKKLDVVSIVGMGGIGKTTLATKVFNDPFVMYHFHVRGWVTVSQTYEKRDLLIQIVESIGIKLKTVGDSYSRLREILHKSLMGKRYLIVIDDIWSTEAWNDMKLYFPNNHTQSRILLISRHKEVVLNANPHCFIHHLEFLTQDESWELLCKKVFHGGNDCPDVLIEPGMKIAKNCHGLPLAVVVIAGVLAKEAVNKESWEKIGRSVNSYISDRVHRNVGTKLRSSTRSLEGLLSLFSRVSRRP